MNKKLQYRNFCNNNPSIPLYLRPIWLDAVNIDWDVLLVEDNNRIIGAMPYTISSKYGVNMIRDFPHTKYSGIYIVKPDSTKTYKQYSLEKKVLFSISEQIKFINIDYYSFSSSPLLHNWSKLYHCGFNQQTLYTYYIPYDDNFDIIWGNMHPHIRNISKNKLKLVIKHNVEDVSLLFKMIKSSFCRQGLSTSITLEFLERIYKTLSIENRISIFTAEDINGRIHGAACFVWDDENLYYEFAGEDTSLRSSNSMTLILLEGIRMAYEKHLNFNFDLGMRETSADFAVRFGAVPLPYFKITKIITKNIFLKNFLKLYFSQYKY